MAYVDNTGSNPHNYSQTTPLTRTEDTSQPVSSTLVAIRKLQTDYEDFHAWMKSATKALSLIPSPILKAGILYDPPTPPALGPVTDEYSVSHQTASWPSISTSTSQFFHSPPPISQAGENRNDLSTERQYDVLNPDPTPRIHSSPIMDITTTNPLNDQNTSYLSRPLQCPFCPGLWFYTSTEYRGHQSIRHPIRQQYPSLLEIMMPEENVQPTELISTEPTPTQPIEPIEPTETTPTEPTLTESARKPRRRAAQPSKPRIPPMTCAYCGIVYTTRLLFRRHNQDMHHDNKPFKCGIEGCTLAFCFMGELDLHVIQWHITEPKVDERSNSWKCLDCGKKYKRENMLKLHMRVIHKVIKEEEKIGGM